ncbi:acetylserotonin O-methyltransferase [Panthera tigris]|uniref:acetylserotonin O-methyltransferase n=1 Tax=Panthera tigris TaxID=9694 RepID=UPI001C6F97C5|nr:acetylserotonin O-methyltransferase [Panthera tigris]
MQAVPPPSPRPTPPPPPPPPSREDRDRGAAAERAAPGGLPGGWTPRFRCPAGGGGGGGGGGGLGLGERAGRRRRPVRSRRAFSVPLGDSRAGSDCTRGPWPVAGDKLRRMHGQGPENWRAPCPGGGFGAGARLCVSVAPEIRMWILTLKLVLLGGAPGSGSERLAAPSVLTDPHSAQLGRPGARFGRRPKMSSPQEQGFRLLTEYTNGFMLSQVLFAACELGVFDLLSEAPEPLGSAAVAVRLGTSSHGTQLLLDTCVSLKLLQVETSRGKALYQNTELSSTYLVRASPKYQGNMLLYLARTTYLCWGHLAQAVRDGKNRYQEAFGVPSDELFTAIYRSEGERVQFMRGLQDVWSVSGRAVLQAFDLSPFRLICDVGGCSGALAKEYTALYPGCRVTVFDTPDVVRAAKEHFPFLEDDRIRFWEGDFFEDPLPEAELYILARVLHDWSDGRCARLLARIRRACKPGGAVLVIESLLDADGRGPLTTQLYSLNMLVQTEGRERTPAQYLALLGPAGFRDVQYRRTGGLYDAILGRTGLPAGCS